MRVGALGPGRQEDMGLWHISRGICLCRWRALPLSVLDEVTEWRISLIAMHGSGVQEDRTLIYWKKMHGGVEMKKTDRHPEVEEIDVLDGGEEFLPPRQNILSPVAVPDKEDCDRSSRPSVR